VGDRYDPVSPQSLESAVVETVAYATKPPEFESLAAEVEFVAEILLRVVS
jgi:hypothetical protein